MPTYQRLTRFDADWQKLSDDQRERFRRAVRKGLRVKRIQITDGVFELTFAPDGRATWHYRPEVRDGEPYIVWRRIGTHDVLRNP